MEAIDIVIVLVEIGAPAGVATAGNNSRVVLVAEATAAAAEAAEASESSEASQRHQKKPHVFV